MILGYNTNGLAHHDPAEAIRVLHDIGYRAVGLTIDHNLCSPNDSHWQKQANRLGNLCDELSITPVIETGARFLLDPWVKHKPTLVSGAPEDRKNRINFLKHSVDVAVEVNASVVSIWSGIPESNVSKEQIPGLLIKGLEELVSYASNQNKKVAFEPEPGMAIATLEDFKNMVSQLCFPIENLGLTLDIGHLHCQDELPITDKLEEHRGQLLNIHIEDMSQGVHEHLMFGEGEINFLPIINKLAQIQYNGPLCVELSRHSHDAVNTARRAFDFLEPLIAKALAN